MTRLAQALAVVFLMGAALTTGTAQAQLAAGKGPIDVTADQLEMVDAQHLAIWRGNVEAVQNGSRLVADTLNVYFQGKSDAPKPTQTVNPRAGGVASVGADWGAVDHLIADGHVFFVSDTQTARGNHAVYELTPDTITITGDVVVVQGDNVVKGDKLIIQVKTGHANIISNATGRNKPERVRGVFYNTAQAAPAQPAGASAAKPSKP
jgi:lipopolysaccharide export system protein LptA